MENKQQEKYEVARWQMKAEELSMETICQEPLLAYVRMVCDEMCPVIEQTFQDYEETTALVPDCDEQGNIIGQHEETVRTGNNPTYITRPSKWPLIFAKRLCERAMTDELQALYDRYSECKELHTTLDYYSLNKDSYFYLCLWSKDYVDDWHQNGTEYNQTNRQFLQQVIDKLRKPDGDVTLSTGKGQQNKIHFDKQHCQLMCEMIEDYMNSHSMILNSRTLSKEKINGQTYWYWKFDKILEDFIKQHGTKKESILKKTKNNSTDIKIMVSRSLYAIRVFNDKKTYYNSHNSDLSQNTNFKDLVNNGKRDFTNKYAEERNLSIYTQD